MRPERWHGGAVLTMGDTSVDIVATLTGLTPTEPIDGLGGWTGNFQTGDQGVYELVGGDVTLTLSDGRTGRVLIGTLQPSQRAGFLGTFSGNGDWPA